MLRYIMCRIIGYGGNIPTFAIVMGWEKLTYSKRPHNIFWGGYFFPTHYDGKSRNIPTTINAIYHLKDL